MASPFLSLLVSASALARPHGALRPRAVRRGGDRHWPWAVAPLLLALALRLLPTPALVALDRELAHEPAAQPFPTSLPAAAPDENFPGSAYFFAQDAFAPTGATPAQPGDPAVIPVAPSGSSPHVLQIDNGPAALSMPMRAATPLDQARALQCMTNAIYYEAGNEPEEGQRAVAQVILNRLASGRWPASVCAVIYQGGERTDRACQFTFSCDGSMARPPAAAAWLRARQVAYRALSGEVFAPAGLATFYHTLAVRPPWADMVRPVAVIGAHIFYRLPGPAGMAAAYRMRYAGRETAQPGPYAFAAPPRALPLLVPPGPDAAAGWTPTPVASATISPMAATTAPPAPLTSYALPQTSSAERPAEGASPSLPQSTIRPEYRNSGRPLH